MSPTYDLVIVGLGSGGVLAAELVARLGLRVAVVERARPGGDCLWTGCVPSKALLASAKTAHVMRTADRFGLSPIEPEIDTELVWKRIRGIQEDIAATDDAPERFEGLGIEMVSGQATVTGPHEVTVDGGRRLETRYILLCTGSHPIVPPIPGLTDAGFVTNEQLFELDRAPRSLVVIGGGPVAVEMAQALTRLGTRTDVIEMGPRLLPRDEPGLVDRLSARLITEGVGLHTGLTADRVTVTDGEKVVRADGAGGPQRFGAEQILVAAGRTPNLAGLGLEEIGVETTAKGVVVDRRMRSTVPSIYAAGDVAGRELFTHAAAYQAGQAVRDMFLPGRAKTDAPIGWVTFTDPELAHLGLTPAEARERHGDSVRVWRRELSTVDRARAESATAGEVVLVTRRNRLLGAHLLAPTAGEMIGEVLVAMEAGVRLPRFATLVRPYPTWSTALSQVAGDAGLALLERYRWLTRFSR